MAHNKKWRLSHKKKIAAYNKKYRASHQVDKEKQSAYMKEYNYHISAEKLREYAKTYRDTHPERYAAKQKKWKQSYKKQISDQGKAYYKANRKELIEKVKKYKNLNKEKIAKQHSKWLKANKKKLAEYRKQPHIQIRINVRVRTREALKGRKRASTEKMLGCTWEELRKHLERLFTKGMSFDNYGLWHIDHILPCASFDLTDPEQQRICFHYSNLQPLWAADNLSKGAKLIN